MATMHSLESIVNTKPTTFKRRGLPLESAYPRRFYLQNNTPLQNNPPGRTLRTLIGRQRRSEGVSNTRSKGLIPGSLPGGQFLLISHAADGLTKGAPARDEQKNDQSAVSVMPKNERHNRRNRPIPFTTSPARQKAKPSTKPFNEAKSLLVRSFTPHKTQEVDYLSLLRTPHLLAVQDLLQTLNLQGVSL